MEPTGWTTAGTSANKPAEKFKNQLNGGHIVSPMMFLKGLFLSRLTLQTGSHQRGRENELKTTKCLLVS